MPKFIKVHLLDGKSMLLSTTYIETVQEVPNGQTMLTVRDGSFYTKTTLKEIETLLCKDEK